MAIHCACLFSKRWKNPLCQVECPFGCLLAGFGKGKWEAAKETEDETKLRLPYQLDGYSDYVVFENKVTTLLVLVNKRRESAPDVKIAHHDLEPDATGPPGAFKLVRTHKINFVPLQNEFNTEKEDAKPPAALQTSVGGMVPREAWTTELARISWSVKWGVNGLMPVRPQVVLYSCFVLPAGKVAEL